VTAGSQEEARGRAATRVVVLIGLALAALAVAFVFLRGGGYEVRARFQDVAGVPKGALVKVGGRPIGKVDSIGLTPDGQGELRLRIDDFGPLREGTQVALRQPSLTSTAGRYVDLMIPDGRVTKTIPNGGVIEADRTSSSVDFDQLFNAFDARTRRGLTQFTRGQAAAYGGRGAELDAGLRYLDPALVAGTRLFDEVNRDTFNLERFLIAQSKLVVDLGGERDSLSVIVNRLDDATRVIAREQASLSGAVETLPPFLRQGNTTFVDLRSTLDAVDPLVRESKPVAPKLRRVLAELRPFAHDAVPTVRLLADVVSRPGKGNDLIELSRAALPFRDIAVGPVQRNGATREGSFPATAKSLAGSIGSLAFLRPYSVDLTGWFDDFAHTGLYDANGNIARSASAVNAFASVNGVLTPIPPELRAAALNAVTKSGQTARCPGANERGALFKPSPDFHCDETQTPVGP
jgi:phospholipid/cholesterol/gamma-HCH transport system substrate-binding protein